MRSPADRIPERPTDQACPILVQRLLTGPVAGSFGCRMAHRNAYLAQIHRMTVHRPIPVSAANQTTRAPTPITARRSAIETRYDPTGTGRGSGSGRRNHSAACADEQKDASKYLALSGCPASTSTKTHSSSSSGSTSPQKSHVLLSALATLTRRGSRIDKE